MNILEACDDPELFAPWFKNRGSWAAWFAFLAALFALPMTDEQTELYRKHTGRDVPPADAQEEAWLIVGRRGGKSFIMALVAVFLACFRSYAEYLQPGERATIAVVAADRRQARTILRYVGAMLNGVTLLRPMIEREVADGFDLNNATTIEVGTASSRSTRGYTYGAVICDELAFWRNDETSAEPDFEILDAIRPGLASIPGSMLIGASSPYARRGALWEAFRKWWSKADAPLVWKGSTREMNPTIRESVIERAMERDEASAKAEYGAEFRTDVEALFTREAVAKVIDQGVFERPYVSGHRYVAFVDPSGGSADSMTMAIAHLEGDVAILDAVREVKPPFSPDAVAKEFSDLVKLYHLKSVMGDRYGGEWPRERFRNQGVAYELAEMTRSELYLALVPAVNSARVALLDAPRLESQMVNLERRTSRGGRDSVDHPPGGHDDVANAVAGAIAMCGRGSNFTHNLMEHLG